MPARPHRTVDRVIEILETVSLSPRGVSLAELAAALDAAKIGSGADQRSARLRLSSSSAIAGFTSGRGRSSSLRARTSWPRCHLITSSWPSWPRLLGCTVLVGVRVGDAIGCTDLVGEESPSLTFVARTHARRPLYTSDAGKTLLANVPDDDMYRLLDLASPQQAGEVRQFLAELPEIRSRRLAFNRGVTLADAFAVATLLLTPDGSLIAAISAAVDASEADRLHAIGEQLKKTVDTLGPKYGLKPR